MPLPEALEGQHFAFKDGAIKPVHREWRKGHSRFDPNKTSNALGIPHEEVTTSYLGDDMSEINGYSWTFPTPDHENRSRWVDGFSIFPDQGILEIAGMHPSGEINEDNPQLKRHYIVGVATEQSFFNGTISIKLRSISRTGRREVLYLSKNGEFTWLTEPISSAKPATPQPKNQH